MIERLKSVKRVIISIGHDSKEVGAVNDRGEKENTIARLIANKVASILGNNGIVVWLMPDYTLGDTIKYLNVQGNAYTDLAVEIHKDSCGELYNDKNMKRRVGLYYLGESAGAGTIAKTMIASMMADGAHTTSWARVDTDSPRRRLGFVRDTKMLAYIYEAGMIEGSNDEAENTWYAQALANAILLLLDKTQKPTT